MARAGILRTPDAAGGAGGLGGSEEGRDCESGPVAEPMEETGEVVPSRLRMPVRMPVRPVPGASFTFLGRAAMRFFGSGGGVGVVWPRATAVVFRWACEGDNGSTKPAPEEMPGMSDHASANVSLSCKFQ